MQEIKLFNTEEFNKGNNQKVILKGNAMPLNETSRNGVFYRPESVKKNYKSLEGVPFLFAHQQNEVRHVLGKVEKVNLTNSHVTYEADIDSEEKEFIRKSEKGYIKHVSVGCLIDPSSVEFDEEKQIAKVDVIEFCELSSAPVPGFKKGKQNLVLLAESLGKEDIIKKLKETQDEEDEENEEETEETEETKETQEDTTEDKVEEEKEVKETEGENEMENEEEKTTEEQVSELNSKLNEMEGKISEVVNQMAVLESKVDTLLDEAEDEDDKDEDDKDKDDTDEKKDKDEEDDEDDEDETEKKENKDDEDKELEPVEEEFKSKEEPIQEIKQKEKTLKIDKKSTEINLENQIKQNRRY